MNELHKKILLDLCVTPFTVIPFVVGASLLMFATVMGAGWGFFGFVLCLSGFGVAATNLMFNYDKAAIHAIEQTKENKKEERNKYLDVLDTKLSSDRDPRDQEALRNLRAIYDSFMEDIEKGNIDIAASGSMVSQINEIFDGCVTQLEKQHEVWKRSRKVTGDLKEQLLQQKSDILEEVEASVKSLSDVVGEVQSLGLKDEHGELIKLQDRLRQQLAAAKETERIIEEADGSDLRRFSEYEKQ